MSQATGHDYLRNHQISGEVLLLDLEEESKAILEAARAAPMGHAAKTLVKDGPLRVIVLGFIGGSSLREHSAGGPVSIQALTGTIKVSTSAHSEFVGPGKVLVFGSAVSHSVTTDADAVLLLTVASPEQGSGKG